MSNSPNPNWKPGDKIEAPFSEMTTLKLEEMEQRERYKLLIGAINPRPIALVSTCNSEGLGNVAPYSFFNGVSSNPTCLVIAVGQHTGGKTHKDTLSNILETGEFVVNTSNEWIIEAVVHTAGDFGPEVDEMELSGLTAIDSVSVKPKRVKESAVHFECKLHDKLQVGDGGPGSSTLVVGRIEIAHVASEAYSKGRIDFDKIRNVGRLGGFSYGEVGKIYDIPVPKVE